MHTDRQQSPQFSYFNKNVLIVRIHPLCRMGITSVRYELFYSEDFYILNFTNKMPIFASSPSAFPTRMRVKHSRGRSPMCRAGFHWTLASWISLQIRAWRPSQPIGGVRSHLPPLGQWGANATYCCSTSCFRGGDMNTPLRPISDGREITRHSCPMRRGMMRDGSLPPVKAWNIWSRGRWYSVTWLHEMFSSLMIRWPRLATLA